jgi:CheY-like chemotaxis protein
MEVGPRAPDVVDAPRPHVAHAAPHVTALFEHTSDVVMITEADAAMNVYHTYASPSMKRVYGYDPEYWTSHTHAELMDAGVFDPADAAPTAVMGKKMGEWLTGTLETPVTSTFKIKHGTTGAWCHIECKVDEVPGTNNRQLVMVLRDITERMKVLELEIAKAKLETARVKDEEHHTWVSHELKNRFLAAEALARNCEATVQEHAPELLVAPHNAFDSFQNLKGQLARGVRICVNQSTSRALVNGTYRPRAEPVHVKTMVDALCPPGARRRYEGQLGYALLDEQLVSHALDNLLANATRHGGTAATDRPITCEARLDEGALVFAVTNAPGKNHAAMRARYGADASPLFEQGARGLTESKLSQGQGMHIANMCADALGGTLTLAFASDAVVATLRVAHAPVVPSARVRLPPDTLVASLDDDEYVREGDRVTFPLLGVRAESLDHIWGATAAEIEGVEARIMRARPNLLLVDQNLDHPQTRAPLRTGTEITRALRAMGFAGKIVIRSANDSSVDHARFVQAGADGSMKKGLSAEATLLQLARVLGVPTEPREPNGLTPVGADTQCARSPTLADARAGAARPSALRCLGVDDDPFMQDMLQLAFLAFEPLVQHTMGATAEEQRAVEDVALGRVDIALAPCAPAGAPYDVVVLDQCLDCHAAASRTGVEIAANLRARGFAGLIVLHTGLDDEAIERVRAEPSLDLVVRKGQDLVAMLRAALDLRRLSAATSDAADERARALVDLAMIRELPEAFRIEHLASLLSPTDPSGLRAQLDALPDGAAHDVRRRLFHRLKGTCAALGLRALASACSYAEADGDERAARTHVCATLDGTVNVLVEHGLLVA